MSERIPPLAALRAFAAVARLGSFARAAETLHVSTSAVSHQVRGLEEMLHATLLTRARNGAGRTEVTPDGAALQRAVEQAFAQLGAACEAVRTRRKPPMLTISASGTISTLWLAPRLAAFAALHPSVQWQMSSVEDEAPDMVREGLDLAVLRVRRGTLADGDRLLFSETVFPVCSPSLRLAGNPEELPRHTLLQEYHVASPEKDWSTWLELLGFGPDPKATIVRFYTFSAALAAAIAGAGIALGRQPLIDPDLAAGRLVPVFPDRTLAGSSDFVIRPRPGKERDRHVGRLVEYLLESAARDPAERC
ncbi:MAG TPA: LysR substrate-binding domain-containing protein [Acetobacteraceae bacterium]|jgi:LysR family glycine cleavage system transcriptional activator|nr:LysR substrate-binding domain-containing protein [Acetobacteraceae bacterium]